MDSRVLIRVTIEDVDKAIKLIINDSNERKQLSRELGILSDKETFMEAVGDSQSEIIGNFESFSATDEDEEDESSDENSENEMEELEEVV
jgi:VIT1/CCC1 family predicted Fe2+/Mn2+ transporter